MIDWNEYELVLKEDSSKVSEVTGEDMGGTESFTCKISDLLKCNEPKWTRENAYSDYGGYQAYVFSFKCVDDEGVHILPDRHYKTEIILKPNEEWSSGWYCFGEWSYCVRLSLRKIENK